MRLEEGGICDETCGSHSVAPSGTRTPHTHTHLYIHTHVHAHRGSCVHAHTPFSHSLPSQCPSLSRGFSLAVLTPLLLLDVGTSYYAVAVVKRSSNLTINTLKGMKSCHTGINRTVGWNVPVGYLVESGRLSVMGCDVLQGEGFWRADASPAASLGFPPPLASPLPFPSQGSLPSGSPSSCTSFKEWHSPSSARGLPDT